MDLERELNELYSMNKYLEYALEPEAPGKLSKLKKDDVVHVVVKKFERLRPLALDAIVVDDIKKGKLYISYTEAKSPPKNFSFDASGVKCKCKLKHVDSV